jgi:hypothetical protein
MLELRPACRKIAYSYSPIQRGFFDVCVYREFDEDEFYPAVRELRGDRPGLGFFQLVDVLAGASIKRV